MFNPRNEALQKLVSKEILSDPYFMGSLHVNRKVFLAFSFKRARTLGSVKQRGFNQEVPRTVGTKHNFELVLSRLEASGLFLILCKRCASRRVLPEQGHCISTEATAISLNPFPWVFGVTRQEPHRLLPLPTISSQTDHSVS